MRTDLAAIVLAGGRSRRFGSDKLAAVVDGRTVLERVVDAASSVASEVIVVVAPDSRRPVPVVTDPRPGTTLVVVEDPRQFEGPLVGLSAGLAATSRPFAVVLAGDAPRIVPGVLDLLAHELRAGESAALALELSGREERLPFAVRTAAAAILAGRLVADGERRLSVLLDRLGARSVPEGRWRELDPEALTVRDVDRPEDLDESGPSDGREADP